MIITPAVLAALRTALRAEFQRAFGETKPAWNQIATLVPSSTASNTYAWLGQFPKLREWIGSRVIKDMAAQGYKIDNKLWESTVGVKRTDIEDDNVGIYKPLFAEMGRAAKSHPDELVFALLKAGATTACYDGQNFFDTDHPVFPSVDGTGTPETVSNFGGGTGTAWYLLDTSRAIKPVLFQERATPELTAMSATDDEEVFMSDEYRYGVRARSNVGFGFWQMAYMSRQDLTPDSFNAAYAAMGSIMADGGRPLGIRASVLVVPPTLRSKALEVVKAERLANGATNVNANVVEVLDTPWVL
jgi:phage major head subunit gpT-like protein